MLRILQERKWKGIPFAIIHDDKNKGVVLGKGGALLIYFISFDHSNIWIYFLVAMIKENLSE
jgi:hypothetical protein